MLFQPFVLSTSRARDRRRRAGRRERQAEVQYLASGNYLLIPQGSRLVGTYDSRIAYALRRCKGSAKMPEEEVRKPEIAYPEAFCRLD